MIEIVALLLFIMVVLTLLNGLIFMRKLVKLQNENNLLLKKLVEKDINTEKKEKPPMPHTELEKYKTQFMQNPYQPPK